MVRFLTPRVIDLLVNLFHNLEDNSYRFQGLIVAVFKLVKTVFDSLHPLIPRERRRFVRSNRVDAEGRAPRDLERPAKKWSVCLLRMGYIVNAALDNPGSGN